MPESVFEPCTAQLTRSAILRLAYVLINVVRYRLKSERLQTEEKAVHRVLSQCPVRKKGNKRKINWMFPPGFKPVPSARKSKSLTT